MRRFSEKIKLKHLFIIIIVIAFVLSVASGMYSSYRGTIKLLEEESLEKNKVYAQKLSEMVNVYLIYGLEILEYSAIEVADKMEDEAALLKEVDRLFFGGKNFNSVIIANAQGEIIAGAPEKYSLKGTKIQSKEGLAVIENQVPNITDPYRAATGKVLITLSHPIFSEDGEYLGLINGTIYIHESNFFETIIASHQYQDGSYVFVVDSQGRIIYHPSIERNGEDVSSNQVVMQLLKGKSGSQRVTNYLEQEMLAGYSVIEKTGWGVVAQTPEEEAFESVGNQVGKMLIIQLPLILVSLLIVVILAGKFVKPLQNIAHIAENSTQKSEMEKLNALNAWYYEAFQIKKALIQSLTFLHSQVTLLKDQTSIDPLTGLMNRRGFNPIFESWVLHKKPFAIVMIDIDHFKDINDTYGHAMGDKVLKFISNHIKSVAREQDVCCRFGGEEFILLLPETSTDRAQAISQQLLHNVSNGKSPCERVITFSAGIASYPANGKTPLELFEIVDEALYDAKNQGRNRIIIATKTN